MTTYDALRAELVQLSLAEQELRLAMSRELGLDSDDKDEQGRIERLPGMPLYCTTVEAATDILPLLTDKLLFLEWQHSITLETHCPKIENVSRYTQARTLIEAEILRRLFMSGDPWSASTTLTAWIGQATSVWGSRADTTPSELTMLWEPAW